MQDPSPLPVTLSNECPQIITEITDARVATSCILMPEVTGSNIRQKGGTNEYCCFLCPSQTYDCSCRCYCPDCDCNGCDCDGCCDS